MKRKVDKLIAEDGTLNVVNDGIEKILIYILLLFSMTSLLKVYIGPLNIIFTATFLILFFIYYLRHKMKIRLFFLIIYIFATFLQNIYINGFNYYNINMLFYFPFLILYFCFFIKNGSDIYAFMRTHKIYVNTILLIWNAIIFVSFFIPSCYAYEGETKGFVSFAGTTFLLSQIAIFIFALLTFQYCVYRKKIYMFALIIPSLCILMGNSRTYIAVLMCAWLIFLYIFLKKQKSFIPIMIICGILFVLIVFVSPIKAKFLVASDRVENLNMDPLAAFTSGRSVFWEYDMNKIFSNDLSHIIFGNGINYLFALNEAKFYNPLWAHNDFIQILSDYGIFGLFIYLYMFKYLISSLINFRQLKAPKVLLGIVLTMWIFNAFFNMFYTYFCATLSFPFYLLILKCDEELRNLNKNRTEKEEFDSNLFYNKLK